MLAIKNNVITEAASAGEMVKSDYRTAMVFRKYGIDFCCGGKWPLAMVCESKQLDTGTVLNELYESTRIIAIPSYLPFREWKPSFLADYIVNVHHGYLYATLPVLSVQLKKFVEEHRNKFAYLDELEMQITLLQKIILQHIQHEEEVVFPYIKQVAHAYDSNESYAGLLVRTLRKPLENIMHHEHDTLGKIINRMRTLTGNYIIPPNACASHRVTLSLLQELDNDLVQHIYLENDILFPRAIAMEKELLQSN
jgi:regulator of cell morphogenesis and NO signaling